MEIFDVAIVGGGPAGSSCAAFCALAGLRALVLEREKFPREKVCGDCLNPSCWSVLEHLGVAQQVRALPHSKLESVEFIGIDGHQVIVDLPNGEQCEISVKRCLFDDVLLKRARDVGAQIREETTVTSLANNGNWKIETATGESFSAQVLVGADGRNSTVARLCNLLPHPTRERVALQAHVPLPQNFGRRIVLQFLPQGYSGQAPVNDAELNLCLVGTPPTISELRQWAQRHFEIAADQSWRTITPLEGIYYALRSGELAAAAISKIVRGEDRHPVLRAFTDACAEMYRGRLWINRLARTAVLWPRVGSMFVRAAQIQPTILKLLTAKVVSRQL